MTRPAPRASRGGTPHDELVAWFTSDDTMWPIPFVNACPVLAFDASCFRAGVLRPETDPCIRAHDAAKAARSPFGRVRGTRTRVRLSRRRAEGGTGNG